MAERRKLETILTANKLVSEEQLKQIVSYAHAVGIDLCEAVLQKKIASPDAVMMAYAESVGLPFAHLADLSVDEEVAAQVEPMTARQHSFVPVSVDHGYVLLATTKPVIPDVVDELRIIFNLPVRCVICTPSELSAAIAQYYPRGAVRVTKAEPKVEPEAKRVKVPPVQQSAEEKMQPLEPMSEEDKKDRLWKTVAAFNFTVASVAFASLYLPPSWKLGLSFSMFLMLGAIVGSVTALITWRLSSR